MFPFIYRLTAALFGHLPLPRGKLNASLSGRRVAATRWIEWARINCTGLPLVWVHGASVGENLAALPVVTRLRAALPGLQVVHSYTSPSAGAWHGAFRCDRADFLPPEEPCLIASVLDMVRPNLLVFSRGDLWPVMTRTAAAFGIPIAVVGGTVNPSSRRLWPLVRRIMASTYATVNWVGAVSRDDADRWLSLGTSADSTMVTGDPRHDQVLERHFDMRSVLPFLRWSSESSVLVAGSTDVRDERVLLDAFSRIVRSDNSDAKLIIAPHDVSDNRIGQVRNTANRTGLAVDIWKGERTSRQARCLVVQKLGVLADLYALADLAYVGGGFRRGGLHAVIEPAAFAVPVIAGPEHRCSRDFQLLLAIDGAVALPRRGAADALHRTWIEWTSNRRTRLEKGLRARSMLQQGAANTSAQSLLSLISRSRTEDREPDAGSGAPPTSGAPHRRTAI